jgi:polyhydroxybutyrate depolymerase
MQILSRANSRLAAVAAAAVVLGTALALFVSGSARSAPRDETTTESTPSGPETRLPPLVHRPSGLGSGSRVPLVVALPGQGGTPAVMEATTHLDKAADRYGFVVAFLDTPLAGWRDASNIAYVGTMIRGLTHSEHIDRRRIYVVGFSLGGYGAFRAGCDLSGRVAAIAAVSQVMAPLARKPCRMSRPVSELNIVGTKEPVPVHRTPGYSISVDQTATIWRTLDGCSSSSPQVATVGPTTETTWSRCNDGSSVAQYLVNGGVHAWPGGSHATGADAQFDATEAIWRFFSRHRAGSSTSAGARLLALHVVGGKLRRIRVLLTAGAFPASVRFALDAQGRTLTARKFEMRRGVRAEFVLTVPPRTRAGRARVVFSVVDEYRRRQTFSRPVLIPAG